MVFSEFVFGDRFKVAEHHRPLAVACRRDGVEEALCVRVCDDLQRGGLAVRRRVARSEAAAQRVAHPSERKLALNGATEVHERPLAAFVRQLDEDPPPPLAPLQR